MGHVTKSLFGHSVFYHGLEILTIASTGEGGIETLHLYAGPATDTTSELMTRMLRRYLPRQSMTVFLEGEEKECVGSSAHPLRLPAVACECVTPQLDACEQVEDSVERS